MAATVIQGGVLTWLINIATSEIQERFKKAWDLKDDAEEYMFQLGLLHENMLTSFNKKPQWRTALEALREDFEAIATAEKDKDLRDIVTPAFTKVEKDKDVEPAVKQLATMLRKIAEDRRQISILLKSKDKHEKESFKISFLPGITTWGLRHAKFTSKVMQDATARFVSLWNDFCGSVKLAETLKDLKIWMLPENSDAEKFWRGVSGNSNTVSFEIFVASLKNWNSDGLGKDCKEEKQNIEKLQFSLCPVGNEVALLAFKSLSKKCWPIVYSMLEEPSAETIKLPVEQRVALGGQIQALIAEFQSDEFLEHTTVLLQLSKGILFASADKSWPNKEILAKWAYYKKASFENPALKQEATPYWDAHRVDVARRQYSFFFQKFQALWLMNGMTARILDDLEFPGLPRIYNFLKICEPLDWTNNIIIMNAGNGKRQKQRAVNWGKGRRVPGVYDFLRDIHSEGLMRRAHLCDYTPQTIDSSFLDNWPDFQPRNLSDVV